MLRPNRNSYRRDSRRSGAPLKIILIVLLPLLLALSPPSQITDEDLEDSLRLTTKTAAQGSITTLTLTAKRYVPAKGYFKSGEFAFFKTGKDKYTALIGTDLYATPGRQLIEIDFGYKDDTRRRYYPLDVTNGEFGHESFSVAKKMVTPSSDINKRIARERELVSRLTSPATEERLWQDAFELPTKSGEVSSAFGTNRVLNNIKRYRHNGLDLRAPTGQAIFASNSGRVVMAKSLYISGNTVAIDHGLGLYTMYSHLSKITVRAGDAVDKETLIGLAGSSGRVTGPHLHWKAKINGATVSPLELIEATTKVTAR